MLPSSSPASTRTFPNLKTWLKGTRYGVSSKHLPLHVNEYVSAGGRALRSAGRVEWEIADELGAPVTVEMSDGRR